MFEPGAMFCFCEFPWLFHFGLFENIIVYALPIHPTLFHLLEFIITMVSGEGC